MNEIKSSPRDLQDHVLLGLRMLAGKCDGARSHDDRGFDKADSAEGHRLADCAELDANGVLWGVGKLHKYHRQFDSDFNAKLLALGMEHVGHYQKLRIDQVQAEHAAELAKPDPILTDDLSSVLVLTDEQESAIERILEWHTAALRVRSGEFKLGGYAGTGKTTVIRELRSRLRCSTVVAAFTGKAVNVLARKGVSARTLHSLLYNPVEDKEGNITFQSKSSLDDYPDLIVVDEASMISTELYNELKKHNIPLLFVGDPGQLEPVGDNPNLMASPTLTLSKIHRQAERSPIIRFATDIRLGKFSHPNQSMTVGDGSELLIRDKRLPASVLLGADQVICAKNKTREELNRGMRAHLGRLPNTLVAGEKIICLRNNRFEGVFNGQMFTVKEVIEETGTAWRCSIVAEGSTFAMTKQIWKEPFLMPLVQDVRVPYRHIYCDYAYAITCHKSQGSEWDHVLVFDEWMPPRLWDMKRWRYTAVTRAAKRLTFCV